MCIQGTKQYTLHRLYGISEKDWHEGRYCECVNAHYNKRVKATGQQGASTDEAPVQQGATILKTGGGGVLEINVLERVENEDKQGQCNVVEGTEDKPGKKVIYD